MLDSSYEGCKKIIMLKEKSCMFCGPRESFLTEYQGKCWNRQ